MGERRRRIERSDAGFTLIEVIVALGIFLVVITALLPQFVAGIRSVAKADREGVSQGILDQQVDRLRGLPFRVSLGSSDDGTDEDVDLLDLYYPNVKPPTSALTCTSGAGLALPATTAGTGYVTSGGCSYEPSTYPFYRTVRTMTNAKLGPMALVYDLQFLTSGSSASPAPVAATPRAGYDSDHATTNYPPSSQVGVTVTVLYRDRGAVVTRSLFTQIANHDSGSTLVRTKVDATAVEISSTAPAGASQSLSAGVVSLEGSVGDISSADVSLSGVVARVATGDPTSSQSGYGATSTVAAPPSVVSFSPVDVTPTWGAGGCTALLCYGASRVASDDGVGVITDGGLPAAGSLTSPLRASITDTGAQALTFDNVGSATGAKQWTGPIVRLVGSAAAPSADCPSGALSGDRVTGAAYLSTTLHSGSQTVRDTDACGGTHAATIGLLPTALAPDGILQVTLLRSYARCTVTNGTPAGATALQATVSVAKTDGGYQPAVPASSFDPGAYTFNDQPLNSFIQGWTFDQGGASTSGASVTAEVPGIRITTMPTRTTGGGEPDPDSAVVVTLGAASCSSESKS